jgi:hypothetical protein
MTEENCIKRASTILIIRQSYYAYHISMNEIGGPVARMGEKENPYRILVGNPE